MGQVHTHYDNLKVVRHAPPEIIRAAYKALAQKYHPDRHGGHADAVKVMQRVNEAYDVLSDPARRQAHDEWIERAEATLKAGTERHTPPPSSPPRSAPPPAARSSEPPRIAAVHFRRQWGWYVIGAACATALFFEGGKTAVSDGRPFPEVSSECIPSECTIEQWWNQQYLATKGFPFMGGETGENWPNSAGTLPGTPRLYARGLSSITIDNSQSDSAIHGKIVHVATGTVAREFFVPHKNTFKLTKFDAGQYQLKYRELRTAKLLKSDTFGLSQHFNGQGHTFSDLTITIYKVKNGNMSTTPINEREF